MDRKEQVTFTNMYVIYDNNHNVLFQEWLDPVWRGVAFPGGHVEKLEDFFDAVIREVFEETGLKISSPQLYG